MTSSVNSESFFGLWCMFGRYIVFAVFVSILITIVVLYKKNKCKKLPTRISLGVVALLIALMFVGGSAHKPGFKTEGVDEFYYSILDELKDENIQIAATGTPGTSWRWFVEDDNIYAMIFVQEDAGVSQIAYNKNDYNSRKAVYGQTGNTEYLFSPLLASKYEQYLYLKTDYVGDFYVEAGRYNISVLYKIKPIGIGDYIGVIFPVFPTHQYELSILT